MKILCTADWHIGKKLESFSRLEEQKDILTQIINIANEEHVDAVIIAGDCFDTQNPSPEMAKLFVKTLAQLSRGGECLVLVIAGNHDNPIFLSSSEAFASQVGVVILGLPNEIPQLENTTSSWTVNKQAPGMIEIYFKKRKRTIRFLMTPYANSNRLKKDLGIEDTDKKAWEILCEQWKKNRASDESIMNIIIAHHFLLPEKKNTFYQEKAPEEDLGERSIVGTIGGISLEELPSGIDYLIAGHIHRAQRIYSSRVKAFYTGSPLVYSLSEIDQKKSVLLLNFGKKNTESVIPLNIKRTIQTIHFNNFDTIFDILEQNQDDYMILIWEGDRYFTAEEHQKLRENHPRILRIESQPKLLHTQEDITDINILYQSDEELFSEYFSSRPKYKNQIPPDDLLSVFQECLVEENVIKIVNKKRGFLPKTLKIKGFYSYKKEIVIDFSSLEEKSFFGIFGAVGSGKSALIEAMILSIFGRVERLGKISSARYDSKNFSIKYSMMNVESQELLIEFTFEILEENGQEEYLCRIHGVRDKKIFTEIKLKREIYKKKSHEWIPNNSLDGEEILGILYEDFRKTIILQQRDFLGFLSASPSENSNTLMRLFQLERFQLYGQVEYLSNENQIIYKSLEDRLLELNDISETQLEEWQAQYSLLQNEIIIQDQNISLKREEFQKAHYKQEQIKKLELIQEKRILLNNQLEEFEQSKKKLQINLLLEYDKKIIQLNQENLELQQNIKKSQLELENEQNQFNFLDHKKSQLKEKLDDCTTNITQYQEEFENLLSTKLLEQVLQCENQIKEYSSLKNKKQKIDDKIQKFEQEASNLDALEQEGKKMRAQEEKLRNFIGLKTAVKYLQADEPCPLCGSLEHPNPCNVDTSIELQDILKRLEITRQKYNTAYLAKKSLTELEKELNNIESTMVQCLDNYNSFTELEEKYTKLQNKKIAQEQKINIIKENLRKLKLNHNDIQDQLKNTQQKLQEGQINNIKLQTQVHTMQINREKNTNFLQEIQNSRKEEFNKLKLNEELYQQIQNYPNKSSSDIEEFFEEYRRIELEYEHLKEFINDDLNVVIQQIRELEDALNLLKQSHDNNLEKLGSIKSSIHEMQINIEKKLNFNKQFDKIKLRKENLDILKSLFKGNGFVKFISQKYLNRLCFSANKRFLQFTKNQYELCPPNELNEKNIMIIDRLAGGIKRDIATLSGGQSFQAALALALALSDESGAGHRFFFIDEGFGSLDEESLFNVLETLRDLTKNEDRIVGVISHIPQIKEEVQTYLNVTLNPKDGTNITWIKD